MTQLTIKEGTKDRIKEVIDLEFYKQLKETKDKGKLLLKASRTKTCKYITYDEIINILIENYKKKQ